MPVSTPHCSISCVHQPVKWRVWCQWPPDAKPSDQISAHLAWFPHNSGHHRPLFPLPCLLHHTLSWFHSGLQLHWVSFSSTSSSVHLSPFEFLFLPSFNCCWWGPSHLHTERKTHMVLRFLGNLIQTSASISDSRWPKSNLLSLSLNLFLSGIPFLLDRAIIYAGGRSWDQGGGGRGGRDVYPSDLPGNLWLFFPDPMLPLSGSLPESASICVKSHSVRSLYPPPRTAVSWLENNNLVTMSFILTGPWPFIL